MNLDEIKKLLDKFYNGTTSKEEEKKIQNYFELNKQLPEDMIHDKALFETINPGYKKIAPPNFEKEISEMIDNLAKKEIYKIKEKRINLWKISALAASVVIAVTIAININKPTPLYYANYETTEQSIIEKTENAIKMLEKTIEKGLLPIKKTNQKLEKTSNSIKNTITKFVQIDK